MIQLRQSDFSYNGKDVTIWTAVETAVAIIGASIPVLRVFFREKVSSYSNSRGGTHHRSGNPHSTLKHIPAGSNAGISAGRRSIALGVVGKRGERGDKEGGVWTRIEPIDESRGDAGSERGVRRERLSDEEIGVALGGDGDGNSREGIWASTTITREIEGNDGKGKSWLN